MYDTTIGEGMPTSHLLEDGMMATVKTIRVAMPESQRIHQAVNRVLLTTNASEALKKEIRRASHALQCALVAAENVK